MKKPIKLQFAYSAEEKGIKCAYGYFIGFINGTVFVPAETVLTKFIAVDPDLSLIIELGLENAIGRYFRNEVKKNGNAC